ncbi:hypothetical protein SEPL_296 [Salmonella phage SE_PL]|uniref:hypothetical protein n=1 Tax=Salmonella enterica TaxID=28901 RepID=UPI000FDF8601|nr:hypothetical protein CPT_Munch_129 [Salmonella phage Munch]EAZ2022922.1 hypothetical protein [Salmonella enterica]ECV9084056.1 hypothetical protein [Salmonella enterica subsp. enterica serovar Infantis]MCP0435842.1 hypothetical protein [Salmonella enterica subsp. enterica serovar Mbandaka]QCW18808.1 hypothetical protein 7t3_0287 [Salmonella phage 7t3]QIG62909.1 hypothetical protein SEPL_296 [Salmonella phage SE_PL]WNV47236.1 hypothetical protein [Klebsiella phage fENko-Kae01]
MQYNLTEEQSTKFYEELVDAIETIDTLNELAIDTFNNWHIQYLANHKSIFGFKPYSIEKFGKKITIGKGIEIGQNQKRRVIYNADGWGANLRTTKIAKLTGRSFLDVLGEVNLVSAACTSFVYKSYEYDEWCEIREKMEKYMQIPYTIDNEWLEVLESLPTKMYYYKHVLGDIE